MLGIIRKYRASEAVFGIVRHFQGVREIAGFADSQDGTEDFLLKNPGGGCDVGDYGGRDVVAIAGSWAAACDQAAFLFSGFDVLQDAFAGALADHGAHVVGGVVGRSDEDLFHFFGQLLDKGRIDFFVHDGARAGRTLLALVAERGDEHTIYGFLEVGIGIDDDGVFAAHLGDHAFNPDLAFLRLGGEFVDAQADIATAGEADEAGFGMLHEHVAYRGTAAGEERETVFGETGFEEDFGELRRDSGGFARRLHNGRVAGDQRSHGHANQNGQWKIPGRDHDAHAQGQVKQLILFAGELMDFLRTGQADHFARVIIAKIDRLGDVGFGLQPSLSGLVDEPGVELELAAAQDARGI